MPKASVQKERPAPEKTLQAVVPESGLAVSFRAAIGWIFTIAVFLIPLTVVSSLADPFTLPKVALSRVAIGLALVFWIARLAAGREARWSGTRLDLPIAALMIVAIAAAFFSTDPRLSLFGHYKRYEDVFTLVGYGLLYFITTNNLKSSECGRLLTASLSAAAIISIYAVWQYFGLDFLRTSAPPGRATATLGNAVFLGNYLAFNLPIALGRLIEDRQSLLKRLIYLIATMVMAAGLVLTFSRGAWVGLIAGVLVLVIYLVRSRAQRVRSTLKSTSEPIGYRSTSWRRLALGILIVGVIFVSANFYRHPAVKQSQPVVDRALSSLDTDKGTVRTRLLLWRTTLGLIAKRPVLGYGPDTLVSIYPTYLPDAYKKIEPLSRIDKAHNDLLNTGATLGLLGLAAYLSLILLFVQSAWERLKPPIIGDAPAVVAGLVGYLAAIQFSFSQVDISICFWLGLGVAAVYLGLTKAPVSISWGSRIKKAVMWSTTLAVAGVWMTIFYLFSMRPAIADYHFQQGLRAESHARMARARTEFEAAVAYNQTRSLYYLRLGRRYQLDGMKGDGNTPLFMRRALSAYANAEALDTTDPNLYTAIGSLYTYLSRNDPRYISLANAAYNRSLAINSYLPETYSNLGVQLAQEGKTEAAVINFKRALKLNPHNEIAKQNLAVINKKRDGL